MLKVQRHQVIQQYIDEHGFARIDELVAQVNAAEITVRRDVNELDRLGKIKKVHGGAQKIENKQIKSDIDVPTRTMENIKEKQAVAKMAATLVKENSIIYLDAGTTVAQMIPYLSDQTIVVYTHGVHHVEALVKQGIECHIIGGQVKPSTLACVGVEGVEFIRQYQFDMAFMGTNGVDESFGFSTPDVNEAAMKRAIIEQSRKAFFLVDDSKFNQTAAIAFADSSLPIITNSKPKNTFKAFTFVEV